ncbi:ureidoglycolate hydrolase [Nitratireductor indicus C115]|uniref:Ureidoglycolate lyase n=1 Tax=Nitratireductor indicus C115 TaxID=1231190 RepID=K2P548_9HYPH|nr:ureidoglycolate lyase [Nitratireductor indicus]EKF42486.1 ureidoglycolate hydrolase [Nitratireductor indicus C115]SFQ56500.1 ureidoglycolate lyase [Nitratireductor indicus]
MKTIVAEALTREAFAPFGDVIETEGTESFLINNGKCRRFHDLAKVEAGGENARVLINIFRGTPYPMPLTLSMVERHPLGSQAFMPTTPAPFLVVVCPDEAGRPGRPRAFLTAPGQGVNYARGTWHGVLTPIGKEQDFVVVDRGGDGNNVEEHFFTEPYSIALPETGNAS